MQIDPGTRIQELGEQLPKARRLFRRLGLATDRHSQLTVSEACSEAGISFKDFCRTLRAMAPEPQDAPSIEDWTRAPLTELVAYIQDRHHVYTRQELIRLGQLLEESVEAHGEKFPELMQIRGHFQLLREDLFRHLDLEERSIFPSILGSGEEGRGPILATLEDLQRAAREEHEAAEELFQNIGVITRNFSVPLGVAPAIRALYLGLRDLEEDLFMHIYLENHVLFPRAVQAIQRID